MADSSVILEVILEGKNLKVVQKDLDQVTSSTNKASLATEKLKEKSSRYNKGQKGVAGATANGTKAFSKMRNEIGGGSSGLVAAYATLAANLFAATAAFNALRSASKVEQLVLGLEAVGVASGRNLGVLAAELKSVTGDAISTEQALRSTALAASAGFSAEQLKGLAVVAKGASIALGRDMTDALDRLVRGTAKLEPEILDELGIFVRLDDAVQDYAESVGKTKGEVTDFERRQAFLNTAISQGKLKFEEIAKSTDPNSYDKLAASLGDLSKEFLNIINVAFIPLIEFLTKNSAAIFGLGAIFASTVSKQLIPGLANTAAAASAAADKASAFAAAQLTSIEAAGGGAKIYNNYIAGLKNGTKGIKEAEEGHKGLMKVINGHKGSITKLSKEGDKYTESIKRQELKIAALEAKRNQLTAATNAATAAENANTRANGFAAIAEGNLKLAVSLLTQDVRNYTASTLAATAGTGIFSKALGLLKIGAYGAATGIRGIGLAFLTFLPWLGLIATLAPVIYNFFKDLFPADRVQEARKSIVEDLSVITKTFDAYSGSIKKGTVRSTDWINANTGVLQTAADTIRTAWKADQAVIKEAVKEVELLRDKLEEAKSKLSEIDPRNVIGFNAASAEIQKMSRSLTHAESKLNDMKDTSATASIAVENAITMLTNSVEKEGQFFLEPQILQLNELKKNFKNLKPQEVIEKLGSIMQVSSNLAASMEGTTNAQKEYNQELVEFSSKSSRPYNSLLEKTVALEKSYRDMRVQAGEAGLSVKELAGQDKILSNAGFKSLEELTKARKTLGALQKNYLEGEKKIVDKQNKLSTKAGLASKNSVALLKFQKEENTFLDAKLGHLRERLRLETEVNDRAQKKTEDSLAANDKLIAEAMAVEGYDKQRVSDLQDIKASLESQLGESKGMNKVQLEISKTEQSQLKNADLINQATVLQVQETSKILDLYNKITKQSNARKNTEMEIAQVKRDIALIESGEGTANAMAQYQIFLDEKEAREAIVVAEYAATVLRIAMEYDLLDAKNQAERARVSSIEGVGEEELKIYTQIEGILKKGRQASLDAAVQSYLLSGETVNKQEANLKRASDLFEKTGGLQLNLDISEASQTVEKVLIDQQNKTLQSRLAVIDTERQLAENKLRAENEVLRGAKNRALSEAQITELNRKELEDKGTLLAEQYLNQIRIINMEYDLLKAKTALQKASMIILQEELKARAAALPEGPQKAAAMAAADTFGKTITDTFDSVLGKGGAIETARNAAMDAASSALATDLSNLGEKVKESQSSSTTARGTLGEGTTYGNIASMDSDESKAFNKDKLGEKVAKMGELVRPMIETLKSLGPEGEVVAALSMASFAIVDTWDHAFEKMGEGLESMAGMASAAAQTIGAVSSVMQAASRANIAEIDNQIKAEQKRDGKSKESIAKIKKLEAQKEKEKKKAFEQNKKMLMAQTVMNTAAAVMATIGKDGWWAIPLAGLIAAMGAAQLAIISGTSYQGGGSSSAASVPSTPTVEVGKRTSSVDVANSQGAAGELAYFRGAKGAGGPENFTPAFMGAKYRNEGGPTAGYTVGEQGPELFVPSVPGTIVPNDEIQQTPQNVNISINAIDSQGVEQVLVEQRGNIIGMIRDAANNIGEDFYEEIETAVYTPSSAGARLY